VPKPALGQWRVGRQERASPHAVDEAGGVVARVGIAHLAGPVAGAGEIAAMLIETGGFRYRDIPAAESGFLLTGSAVVRDDDNEATLDAGEGYWLAPGWTGTFEAVTPVTKVFYLL
jgi:uncharacterized cupin superfamily protein